MTCLKSGEGWIAEKKLTLLCRVFRSGPHRSQYTGRARQTKMRQDKIATTAGLPQSSTLLNNTRLVERQYPLCIWSFSKDKGSFSHNFLAFYFLVSWNPAGLIFLHIKKLSSIAFRHRINWSAFCSWGFTVRLFPFYSFWYLGFNNNGNKRSLWLCSVVHTSRSCALRREFSYYKFKEWTAEQ